MTLSDSYEKYTLRHTKLFYCSRDSQLQLQTQKLYTKNSIYLLIN